MFVKVIPSGSVGKESTCNSGDAGSVLGLGRFLWRRAWQPIPVFLSEETHGQRNLAGYSPQRRKESDTTEVTGTHAHMASSPKPFFGGFP